MAYSLTRQVDLKPLFFAYNKFMLGEESTFLKNVILIQRSFCPYIPISPHHMTPL